MLDKLTQAAIITFLLYLLSGLSSTTKIPSKVTSTASPISAPVASWVMELGE
ncbi:MAG: hypothetical protein KME64_08830 [Scytonematopsis contorta HA4267-MV1]|jgi:hypothetical protein|nr:hypothetical protein [Scytonematopsis contorta HA4267-MV1]